MAVDTRRATRKRVPEASSTYSLSTLRRPTERQRRRRGQIRCRSRLDVRDEGY